MKFAKRLSVLFTVLGFYLAAPSAHATHIGGYLGAENFGFPDTRLGVGQLSGGADAAFGDWIELGGFWQQAKGTQTLLGGELLLYPAVLKLLYVEGKAANASLYGQNHFAYGPGAGINLEILPGFLSIGADVTYFFYSGGGHDLSTLGDVKIWL